MEQLSQQIPYTSDLGYVPKEGYSSISYEKTFKTHQEQILLLKSRKLRIDNEAKRLIS